VRDKFDDNENENPKISLSFSFSSNGKNRPKHWPNNRVPRFASVLAHMLDPVTTSMIPKPSTALALLNGKANRRSRLAMIRPCGDSKTTPDFVIGLGLVFGDP
jgi:hypothetical protein